MVRLWRYQDRHKLWRKALHAVRIVLVFFSVPPSLRQAAGPLTENLPNVFVSDRAAVGLTGDRDTVELSLERPSPRGTKCRLFSRVPPPADWFCNVLARLTTKRGHLA